eukprot:1790655-Alexandrium_andersonii.AAC.1
MCIRDSPSRCPGGCPVSAAAGCACPKACEHYAVQAGGAWVYGRMLEVHSRPRAAAGRGNPPLGGVQGEVRDVAS